MQCGGDTGLYGSLKKWFGAMIADSRARRVAALGTRFELYLTTERLAFRGFKLPAITLRMTSTPANKYGPSTPK